jgi:excisionase family DNA binding protein
MSTTLTLPEVARFLRVHPSTIYRLLKQHDIRAFRVGYDWRFTQETVESWTKRSQIDKQY